MEEVKQRVIQEYVPGRQITLAHLIASPQRDIYIKLGLDDEAATAIVRKIRGNRTTSAKAAAATDTKVATVSTSQQSYDSVLDNYERYVQYIAATPEYAPNEDDIKLPALKALAVELRAKNTACNNAKVAIDNARMARNRALYTPLTGLVDVALDAKTYIKSLFGATSPEYKLVGKIDFTKA